MNQQDIKVCRLTFELIEGKMTSNRHLLNQAIDEMNDEELQTEVMLAVVGLTAQLFLNGMGGDRARATHLVKQMVAAGKVDEVFGEA